MNEDLNNTNGLDQVFKNNMVHFLADKEFLANYSNKKFSRK